MKTYKILPKINNVKFSGRLIEDPEVRGKRITFTVIHNMGGDKLPVFKEFILFADSVPEYLKKGKPVVVNARLASDDFTNKEGKKVRRQELIVKNVKEAATENNVVEPGNNIDLACRLSDDPKVNEAGTRATFIGIRNYGGGKPPVSVLFVMLRKSEDPAFPEFLKKGAAVVVSGFFSRSAFTSADGEEIVRNFTIARQVEPAELVEKQYKDNETVTEGVAEDTAASDEEVIGIIEADSGKAGE